MITRSGWITLVAGVVALLVGTLTGWVEIAYLGIVAVVAFGVAFTWLITKVSLDVTRNVAPVRVTVGETAIATLEVSNPGLRATAPMVATERIGALRRPVEVPRIARRGVRTIHYRLPTDRRGVFDVGPLVLSRSDPFRLVGSEQTYGTVETLFVHPRRFVLREIPSSMLRSLESPSTDNAPSGTVSFHTLREYVPGDDRRHIHWKTTARTGTLMVKKLVDTSLPDLTMLVDTNTATWSGDQFEDTVEIAASLAWTCAEAGFPVRLHTTDGATLVPTGSEAPGPFFLDRLAGLETKSEASIDATLSRLLAGDGGVNFMLLTRSPSMDTLARVAILARRYRTIVVVDVDSGTLDGVRNEPAFRLLHTSSSVRFAEQWNSGLLK